MSHAKGNTMLFQHFKKTLSCALLLCLQFAPFGHALSQTLAPVPPNISTATAKPMMMITASRDQTLFGPAYTDFEDVDGDDVVDFTFKPEFSYYGYFDSGKCYTYSTLNGRFEPAVAAVTQSDGHITCTSTGSYWAGNFLNWATMTRVDVVRKMLYGGKRSTDTTALTVLERANLSQDAHSFAKFYAGTDIRDYTPFTTANLTKTTGANANVYAGLTICNRSNSGGSGGTPVLRMAKGNYELWATTAGSVCRWSTEGGPGFAAKVTTVYGTATLGAAPKKHESAAPILLTDGAVYSTTIGPELNVRVVACNSTLLGNERCQPYGTSTLVYKPIGLLQEFGVSPTGGSAKAEFGVITGSYDSNIEGGALRKNIETFDAEIDLATGRFCHLAPSPLGTCTTGYKGGIAAIDSFALYGAGNYNASNGLDFALPDEMTNGLFPAWGNPMGEMVLQAIRYFAGLPVAPAAKAAGLAITGIDASLGMPTVAATNPFTPATARDLNYGKAICRPLSILGISSSAVGYDRNFTGFDDLPNRGGRTAAQFTNLIGDKENISGTVRTVGSVTGGFGTDCSAKTVTTLDLVTGVCPDLPGAQGSYLVGGASFYANTNRVRAPGASPPTDLPASALTVKTYAASLAGGLGRVEIKVPGTNKFVYLTPESSWNDRDYVGGGARQQRYPNRPTKTTGVLMPGGILVFKAISSSATHGAFVVTWNDTQAGNDYDMDITGFLRYDITGSGATARIKVTTEIMDQEAGAVGSHGYSIVGTDADGKYITHGINAFRDEGTCLAAPCSLNTSATNLTTATRSFSMTGVQDVTVEDPLWYAAKYGSFDTAAGSFGPGQTLTLASWDQKRADGRACGGATGLSCSDGVPDGYFFARRPELLERQLRDQLEQIVASSNAAPAVSASTLDDGDFKYEANFDATVKKGSVYAKQLNQFGKFNTVPTWDAGEKLKQLPVASRQIITNDDAQNGISFVWSSLNTTYTTALKGTNSASLDARALALIDYVRGSTVNEAPSGQKFQARSVSNLLGTIVNSSPWIESRPSAFFNDTLFASGAPSYASHRRTYLNREKLLWIGSNDGLLHAFKAVTGDPVISYLPRPLVPSMEALVSPSTGVQTAGMDGSPFSGEVLVTPSTGPSTWSTYLFSSLGRGGRGIFALDVTKPADLVQSNAANIFKWQFTSADDADLGYVIGDPRLSQFSGQASQIVRLNGAGAAKGRFAILVPNGLGSASGRAKLIILLVDGPGTDKVWALNTHYYELDTVADTGNGMMGVDWIDTNADGIADFVYGTDVKGNVWKFNISDTNPANWGSAFKTGSVNIPFYSARNSAGTILPITTAPGLGFPPEGGVMVTFGTGKSLVASGDFPNTTYANRMYGVYDRSGTTATFTLPTGTSTLVMRPWVANASGTSTVSLLPSEIKIDLATKNGWYFNFPAPSEMMLSSPDVKPQYMLFTAVKAADTTANQCFYTPPGQLYTIDPLTGVPNATNFGKIVDPITGMITFYGGVPIADQKVGSTRDSSSLVTTCTDGSLKCTCKSNPAAAGCAAYCATNPQACIPSPCDPNTLSDRVYSSQTDLNTCMSTSNSRVQWREIPGLKTRTD